MSTAEGFRQDMPPKGGYSEIQWERIPLKKAWSGARMFAAYIGITVASFYVYGQNITWKRNIKRENDEVTVALEPLLLAERDRLYLNQIRKNREEEAELMKNVPGWKVGTIFGEPLYKTTEGAFVDPPSFEYYAHTDDKHRHYMHTFGFWL